MANYWVDHVQGWLSGVPADVIAAKRDIEFALREEKPAEVLPGYFDKITDKDHPQHSSYQRAWNTLSKSK